jgi:hypothetical protein
VAERGRERESELSASPMCVSFPAVCPPCLVRCCCVCGALLSAAAAIGVWQQGGRRMESREATHRWQ